MAGLEYRIPEEYNKRIFEILEKQVSGIATTKDMVDFAQNLVNLIAPGKNVKVAKDQSRDGGYDDSDRTLFLGESYIEDVINHKTPLKEFVATIAHEMRHFYQYELKREVYSDPQKLAQLDEYSRSVIESLDLRSTNIQEVRTIFGDLLPLIHGFDGGFSQKSDEQKREFCEDICYAIYADSIKERDARKIEMDAANSIFDALMRDPRCSDAVRRELQSQRDLNVSLLSDIENLRNSIKVEYFTVAIEEMTMKDIQILDRLLDDSKIGSFPMDTNRELPRFAIMNEALQRIVQMKLYEKSPDELSEIMMFAMENGVQTLGSVAGRIAKERLSPKDYNLFQNAICDYIISGKADRKTLLIDYSEILDEKHFDKLLNTLLDQDRIIEIDYLLSGDVADSNNCRFPTFQRYSFSVKFQPSDAILRDIKVSKGFVKRFAKYAQEYFKEVREEKPGCLYAHFDAMRNIITSLKDYTDISTRFEDKLSNTFWEEEFKSKLKGKNRSGEKGLGLIDIKQEHENAQEDEKLKPIYSERFLKSVEEFKEKDAHKWGRREASQHSNNTKLEHTASIDGK